MGTRIDQIPDSLQILPTLIFVPQTLNLDNACRSVESIEKNDIRSISAAKIRKPRTSFGPSSRHFFDCLEGHLQVEALMLCLALAHRFCDVSDHQTLDAGVCNPRAIRPTLVPGIRDTRTLVHRFDNSPPRYSHNTAPPCSQQSQETRQLKHTRCVDTNGAECPPILVAIARQLFASRARIGQAVSQSSGVAPRRNIPAAVRPAHRK